MLPPLAAEKLQNFFGVFLQFQIGVDTVSDLFLCGSADVCTTLAKAGFGIAVQPDFPSLRDPALAYIPIRDVEPLSYGAYYRSVTGKPLLKLFLQSCKDNFPVRPEEEING